MPFTLILALRMLLDNAMYSFVFDFINTPAYTVDLQIRHIMEFDIFNTYMKQIT